MFLTKRIKLDKSEKRFLFILKRISMVKIYYFGQKTEKNRIVNKNSVEFIININITILMIC